MFCPDCGGICDSRGLCPACEQRARERAIRNGPVYYKRIFQGKRKGQNGTLVIGRGSMTIHKKGSPTKIELDYWDITQVFYYPASAGSNGFIAVCRKRSIQPIASSLWQAERSDMALIFSKRHNRRFQIVYEFLARQVNMNRVLEASSGYLQRSPWKYCPMCASRDIYNPYVYRKYYYRYNNLFMCRICGFCWAASDRGAHEMSTSFMQIRR